MPCIFLHRLPFREHQSLVLRCEGYALFHLPVLDLAIYLEVSDNDAQCPCLQLGKAFTSVFVGKSVFLR